MAVTTIEILSQYSFYRDAPELFQEEIADSAGIAILEPNTLFYEKGNQCSHIALVGSGSVRVFIVGETGREVTLYHVRPSESCPINILSVLINMGAPAMAIVEETLEAVVLPAGVFRQWVSKQPVVRQYAFEALASRLADVFSLMEEIKFRKMDHRLAEFLLNQFEHSDTDPPAVQVTHERIAVELGSAREVISRLLRDFERMGSVKLARGRIAQKDQAMLHKLIGN